MIFDFRSDTVTKPTPGMYRAMDAAPLGDDVLGDDPTVFALEGKCAELLGKEAALFVPSGTMSNLLAVFVHCRPGEEFLCEENSHVYIYEQAGYAQLNAVSVRTLPGNRGIFDTETLESAIRRPNIHFPDTKAVFLENTHNRGGGSIWPFEKMNEICATARNHGLSLHLDGARLMNAVIATGYSAKEWGQPFDTISLCFSKGLGAPVGSVLVGDMQRIQMARRRRKVLGGGMRQAGVLAAAALYALDNHVARLVEDHQNAVKLADAVREMKHDKIRLKYETIDTNMVFFELIDPALTAERFCQRLEERGIQMLPLGPTTVRAVTHLDVNEKSVAAAIDVINNVLGQK